MRKSKRIAGVCLAVATMLSSVFCSASAKEPYHFLIPLAESHPSYQAILKVIEETQKIIPDFEVEMESIPNHDQYQQKLRTYIAGNNTPEIFNIAGNSYDAKLVKEGKVVDLKPVLEELGYEDKMYSAAMEYQTFQNGFMFALPEGIFGESFWYWKKPFEEIGAELPKTFDEMLKICGKLKEHGYIPASVSGKETWQLIRWFSFIPFRATGNEFINQLKKADISAGSEIGQKSAEFMQQMGTQGYFQNGFSTADYTASLDTFLSGSAVMFYTGSWESQTFAELYENGEIGMFAIPDVDGMENNGYKTFVHSGFGYGFAADTFDENLKTFVKVWCDTYGKEISKTGASLSPMKEDSTENLPLILKDLLAEIDKTPANAVLWDSALDPATNIELPRELNELALGSITIDEFAEQLDECLAENAPKFYTEDLADMF